MWAGARDALPAAPAPPRREDGEAPPAGPARARPVLFAVRRATVLVEGRAVLREVDWTIRAGERWVVTGANGAGKSTLLRLLAGEEQPATGAVERLGLGPRSGAEALRGRIGAVSPELQARHRLDATGASVVLSGFAGTIGLAVEPTGAQRAAAAAAAARLGVLDLLDRHVLSLSYGELRKLLLARALAPGPEVLLLDEPLAGLDPAARAWTLRVLDEAGLTGAAIVAVSHHADELPGGADGVAFLEGGRLRGVPAGAGVSPP